MSTSFAILLLLAALMGFAFAIVALIRKIEHAEVEQQRASTAYNLTWAFASLLAAVSMSFLFDLRWIWVGLVWGEWLLAGWYCKWFGIPFLTERLLRRSVGLWDWQDTTNLREVPPDKIVDRKSLIVSAIAVLFWASFLLFSVITLDREITLRQDGITIKAIVTNERVSKDTQYEVQYRFSPDDQASWYTASDAMGRSNLWESLTKDDYDLAVTYGKVDVLFLPQNPWVNRPLRSASSNASPVVLLVSSLGFVGFGLFAFRESKKYVVQRLGQPPKLSWL